MSPSKTSKNSLCRLTQWLTPILLLVVALLPVSSAHAATWEVVASGLAVGPEGALYVSNFGAFAGAGEVVRITPSTSAAPADGAFTAAIDFSSLRTEPVGANCQLTVQGTLTFSGRLAGDATATTRALVMGDCSSVVSNPPGTFADVFQSELLFTGTLDGAAVADLAILYQGKTAVGGAITGQVRLANGRAGVLDVEGVVAQGGSYWFRTP
ncbi:MAG: hypothetical protein DYG89_08135 [Caldilinea sp. CFX5]|nr:hypothetical protein [Caldilinea sp. CFX5]